MRRYSVSIVSVGSLKYSVDMKYLENWRSRIVTIKHGASISHIPNAVGTSWEYTDGQLIDLIHEEEDADFTFALINAGLESNYYLRRLGDKVCVLSLYEMAEIVKSSNFTVEHYILRNIYEILAFYVEYGGAVPTHAYNLAHDDVRGCLFDMNPNKTDIVFSMNKPFLCDACRARMMAKQISAGFMSALDSELIRINRSLYFRIVEWIKAHPVCAILGTALSTIAINLASNFIFEVIK